ncbi:MAG TPA: hypothetical protein VJ692_13490 [Nitrospiraceae bacterium]|nr:hypothetical protein [Nitrospiraceae bacterium]
MEQSGIYIEPFLKPLRKIQKMATLHLIYNLQSLEIRTIAAAVRETEILDRHRALDHDRLVFYLYNDQATVNLNWLAEAVKRLKS